MRKGNLFPEHIEETETMRNLIDFSGKKIIVAGASSGIGRQTAIVLSTVGARVILIARREEKLQETLRLLEGEGHSCYAADLSDLEGIEPLFKRIYEEQGASDGLVYCAGINSTLPLQQLKPQKLQDVFQTNFFGFIETVRQAVRRGRFNEGMRIVAVSSNAAIRGDKAHTAYSSSKAAMNAAVRCLAKELADKGININAVSPAVTNTEIYRQYASESSDSEKALMERQYLGLIEPEDVADSIVFLLSPAAKMITGTVLFVDGGLSSN